MQIFRGIFTFFRLVFLEDSQEKISMHICDFTEKYNDQLEKNYLDCILVGCKYEDIKSLLKSYKYQWSQHFWKEISSVYIKVLEKNFDIKTLQKSVIVPVPTHWRRWLWRGFDHMKYISKIISQKHKISHQNILSTLYTPQQSKLSRKERLINKKHAFTVRKNTKIPESIILIDDIISTGSTINECAKVLKKHGAKKVYGIFLATNQ